jgi:hypothetical protein
MTAAIDEMRPCVLVIVTDPGETEVLRMRAPAMRRITYICPMEGVYRWYIVWNWDDDWRTQAVDEGFVSQAVYGQQHWHAAPSERATWGDIQ